MPIGQSISVWSRKSCATTSTHAGNARQPGLCPQDFEDANTDANLHIMPAARPRRACAASAPNVMRIARNAAGAPETWSIWSTVRSCCFFPLFLSASVPNWLFLCGQVTFSGLVKDYFLRLPRQARRATAVVLTCRATLRGGAQLLRRALVLLSRHRRGILSHVFVFVRLLSERAHCAFRTGSGRKAAGLIGGQTGRESLSAW